MRKHGIRELNDLDEPESVRAAFAELEREQQAREREFWRTREAAQGEPDNAD